MKRTHIALAASLLFIPLASMAQAQFGSEIYGQVGAGVNHITNQTGGGSINNMTTDQLALSFLGFRGREDLGGGLSALYKLESTMDPSVGALGKTVNGTNVPFSRFSYVGLAGDKWGTVTVGRQWASMIELVVYQLDVFNVGGPGAYTVPLGLTGTNRYSGYDSSASNSVKYRYGGPQGLQLSATYGFGGVAGNGSLGSQYSYAAAYSGSNYNLGAGYIRYNSSTAVVGTNIIPTETAWTIGGNATFGSLKPYFAFYNTSSYNLKAGSTPQGDKITTVGLRWDLAPFVLRGAYYNDRGNALDSVVGRNGNKNTVVLGAEYWMSKHTNIYVAFSNNSLTGGYMQEAVFTGALNRNPTANSVQLYSVGMNHTF